jgi:hypothetical protein
MGDSKRLAEILMRLSGALFAIYAVCVVVDSLPIRLRAPEWHFIVASSLVNFVTIPLVAHALLQLAYYLTPTPRIEKVLTQVGKASRLAVLGFLLLLPLLAYSSFQNANQVLEGNARQRKFTQRSVELISKAIQDSSSAQELQARMVSLQGPRIANDALKTPLPQLKQQVQAAVKQAAATIETQLRNPLSSEYLPLYKQYLRTALLALASAIGFSALAWWPSKTRPLFSASLFGREFSLNPTKLFAAIKLKTKSVQDTMQNRSNQAVAREGWKKMKDNQKRMHLLREKERKRNEVQMRKLREKLKRESDLKRKAERKENP